MDSFLLNLCGLILIACLLWKIDKKEQELQLFISLLKSHKREILELEKKLREKQCS